MEVGYAFEKGLRCGEKAAGDPVYKHQGPKESRILLNVYTYSCLIGDCWVMIVMYLDYGTLIDVF